MSFRTPGAREATHRFKSEIQARSPFGEAREPSKRRFPGNSTSPSRAHQHAHFTRTSSQVIDDESRGWGDGHSQRQQHDQRLHDRRCWGRTSTLVMIPNADGGGSPSDRPRQPGEMPGFGTTQPQPTITRSESLVPTPFQPRFLPTPRRPPSGFDTEFTHLATSPPREMRRKGVGTYRFNCAGTKSSMTALRRTFGGTSPWERTKSLKARRSNLLRRASWAAWRVSIRRW